MKKIIVLMLAMVTIVAAQAQEKRDHRKTKRLPG